MTTVAVILLSYNRPRMLCEALGTIKGCDQLIVTDDGSDFDVRGLVRGCYSKAQFVINEPMSVAERLKAARLGNLINRALELVECDVVTYLCDDDLFHLNWIPTVKKWFDEYPESHWMRGAWFAFEDDDPSRKPSRCKLDPRQLTTGNFAHRIECFHYEDVRWDETTVASHDHMFLVHASKAHDMYAVSFCNAVAGWRRLHRHNALGFVDAANYAPHAHTLFANGMLE